MASLPKTYYTPEQYLEMERKAEYKTEYIAGQLRPMPLVNETHNIMTLNIAAELAPQLRGKNSRVYISNMRVRGSISSPYFYPDIVVAQGGGQFEDEYTDTLINPGVVIEILSPASELYDRGEKFAHYRHFPSLTDYVLISQYKMRAEHYTRQDENHWLLSVATEPQDELALPSIECMLALAGIYENIEFSPLAFHAEAFGTPIE